MSFSQEKLDSTEVFLVQCNMSLEFFPAVEFSTHGQEAYGMMYCLPGKSMEVGL